ncbi:MAG: hypothetical protein ACKVQR_22475 [Aquabacterium sp.]
MTEPTDPPDFDPNDLLRGFREKLAQRETPLDVDSLFGDLGGTARPAAPRPPATGPSQRGPRGFGADDVEDIPHIDLPPVPREMPALTHDDLRIDIGDGGTAPADTPQAAVELDLPDIVDAPQPDAQDLDSMVQGVARQAEADAAVEPLEADWEPATAVAMRRQANPRLLGQWAPGAWIGALRRAHGAASEVVQGPDGPVVETFAPQLLVALWPPQALDTPLLPRWPARVMLTGAEGDAALESALAMIPADAALWVTHDDIDWALVADIALHHEAALRHYQIEALRALAVAEREAAFARVNSGYVQPAPGQPVQARTDPAA